MIAGKQAAQRGDADKLRGFSLVHGDLSETFTNAINHDLNPEQYPLCN